MNDKVSKVSCDKVSLTYSGSDYKQASFSIEKGGLMEDLVLANGCRPGDGLRIVSISVQNGCVHFTLAAGGKTGSAIRQWEASPGMGLQCHYSGDAPVFRKATIDRVVHCRNSTFEVVTGPVDFREE